VILKLLGTLLASIWRLARALARGARAAVRIACNEFAYRCATGSRLTGRVVGVGDGDSLTVRLADRRRVRVRLAGIDAPERKQAFGAAAHRSLIALAMGKSAHIRVVGVDEYGRILARVRCGDVDLSLAQAERGMAWTLSGKARDRQIAAAERQARRQRIGLWSAQDPLPPWVFRRKSRAWFRW